MVSNLKGIISTVALFAAGLWVLKPKTVKKSDFRENLMRERMGFEGLGSLFGVEESWETELEILRNCTNLC